MTEAHLLAGEELERTIHRVAATYNGLMGKDVHQDRPPLLFEILLQAYPGHDADSLVARLESLVAGHGHVVRQVIEDHSPGAADYVEARDWIYDGPEVLLVADLARNYPSRLRAVAAPSDFAAALDAMAYEMNGK